MILLILRGVPASGKSTHAAQLQKEGWTVVNRDSIRFAMYGKYWGKDVNEDVVTDVENMAIQSALASNANVVVDATNLNRKALKTKLSLASRYGAWVAYEDFPIAFTEAYKRDQSRQRQVGERVLRDFFTRYKIDWVKGTLPAPEELWPKFEPYVRPENGPDAYIYDTDGTLANHEGIRNVYDPTKYHLDTVHAHVAEIAGATHEMDFVNIALSGRDDTYRDATLQWYEDNDIWIDYLIMRPAGDKRVDAIVKYELFKEKIEPRFNVIGAFDDRPQVIRMWRAIGVPVFDVGNGIEF